MLKNRITDLKNRQCEITTATQKTEGAREEYHGGHLRLEELHAELQRSNNENYDVRDLLNTQIVNLHILLQKQVDLRTEISELDEQMQNLSDSSMQSTPNQNPVSLYDELVIEEPNFRDGQYSKASCFYAPATKEHLENLQKENTALHTQLIELDKSNQQQTEQLCSQILSLNRALEIITSEKEFSDARCTQFERENQMLKEMNKELKIQNVKNAELEENLHAQNKVIKKLQIDLNQARAKITSLKGKMQSDFTNDDVSIPNNTERVNHLLSTNKRLKEDLTKAKPTIQYYESEVECLNLRVEELTSLIQNLENRKSQV